MPLMLMSNPGLSFAVLGNPRRKARRVARKTPRRLKRSAFLKAYRRAAKRVGKTYKTRGRGRYKIEAFRGVLARRHHWHVPGIPWSGRRGYLSFSARVRRAGERRFSRPHVLTNPRSRKHTMRRRRNPNVIANYVAAAKAAPGDVKRLFTGPNKVKNIAFAAGGAAVSYLIGGIVAQKVLTPILARIPYVGGMVATPMGSRIVGGMVPFTVGYIASKFVKGDIGKALLVGGAAASIVELIKPGMVGQLIARVPGVPMLAAQAPAMAAPAIKGPTKGLEGLGGYVSAPSYAGVGGLDGYVSAPSYAGVGDEDDLAGYVSAPSYAGVGDDSDLAGPEDVMAGVDGYLDQSAAGYQSYLAA